MGALRGVGREGVDLRLVDQLQAVLDGAEEAVGGVEGADLGGVDVAGLAELVEGLERVGGADPRVVAGVDQLEELHGELDVAQAAAALLDLALGQPLLRDLLLRPGLHHADLADGVGVEPLRPHVRLGRLDERPAELGVAGHRPGLDEGLELPVRRPLVPVGPVGVEAPRQGAGPALGAEVGVGAEDDAVGRRLGHGGEQVAGDPLGRGAAPLVDEEDVDVAGVVELPPAELSHADDGHPPAVVDGRLGESQRRLEAALRPATPARGRPPAGRPGRAGPARRCAAAAGASSGAGPGPGRRRRHPPPGGPGSCTGRGGTPPPGCPDRRAAPAARRR